MQTPLTIQDEVPIYLNITIPSNILPG